MNHNRPAHYQVAPRFTGGSPAELNDAAIAAVNAVKAAKS